MTVNERERMKLTTVKALRALVEAHDDKMETSEQWDNARGVLALPGCTPRTRRSQFEINVKRFGPADEGTRSKCYIAIYDGQNEMRNCIIVIAEQILDGDAGVSITNAAESYAQQVGEYFDIPLNKLVWIEYYPQRGTNGRLLHEQESFDRVVFNNSPARLLFGPRWNHIDRETVEHWIGGAL